MNILSLSVFDFKRHIKIFEITCRWRKISTVPKVIVCIKLLFKYSETDVSTSFIQKWLHFRWQGIGTWIFCYGVFKGIFLWKWLEIGINDCLRRNWWFKDRILVMKYNLLKNLLKYVTEFAIDLIQNM